jgi:hypothetical protein
LGEPLAKAQQVSGGLLNELWYLSTTKGHYAIKSINDKNQEMLSHNLLSPELAEEIAEKMKRGGIPTVVALKQNNQFSFHHDNNRYIVMPWIFGKTVAPLDLPFSHLPLLGEMLGKMQKIKVHGNFFLPKWRGCNEQEWKKLLQPIETERRSERG